MQSINFEEVESLNPKKQSSVPGNGRMAVARNRKFRNQKNGKNKHSKS